MCDYILLITKGLEVKSLGFGLKLDCVPNPGLPKYSLCNLEKDTKPLYASFSSAVKLTIILATL